VAVGSQPVFPSVITSTRPTKPCRLRQVPFSLLSHGSCPISDRREEAERYWFLLLRKFCFWFSERRRAEALPGPGESTATEPPTNSADEPPFPTTFVRLGSLTPLLVVMSFDWANALLFRLGGSTPVARGRDGGQRSHSRESRTGSNRIMNTC